MPATAGDTGRHNGASYWGAAPAQGRARRGALSYAALAASELDAGNPDAAAHHAHHVVDLTAQITSSRCVHTVRDLATRLKPIVAGNPASSLIHRLLWLEDRIHVSGSEPGVIGKRHSRATNQEDFRAYALAVELLSKITQDSEDLLPVEQRRAHTRSSADAVRNTPRLRNGSGDSTKASLEIRALRYHTSESDTVEIVLQMGRADVKRRSIISAPFVMAALAAPSRDWLLSSLDSVAGQNGPRQVGMDQVADIRDMFVLFQEMDVMRGGGHARIALVEYLNSYVLPLLQRDHANQAVQLALYEAASEQAYLVGWMAYDDGRHGLGQRYLIQALRLAQASGNRALGAHVLASMSDQANLLGNPREALTLARAGAHGISTSESPACMARLLVLQARAQAAQGEAAAAAQTVAAAERAFEQVRPHDEPEWARFIDPAYLYGEAAHCLRGDPAQTERFATLSADAAAQQGRARRGALSYAALAVGELNAGNPDAAAHHVVDLTAQITSSRCVHTVRDLATRLKPYNHLPEVRTFHTHATNQLAITL